VGKKISIAKAAEETGQCSRTIRRYIALGRLPAYRVGPRAIRIDTDDLAALLRPINGTAGGDVA
jgi:excisionase family DNA binding protein